MIFLSSLFVLGSFGFWILSTVAIIALLFFVEYERGYRATISILLYAFIIWLANGQVDILSWIGENWFMLVKSGVMYIFLAIWWAVAKVWFTGNSIKHKTEAIRKDFRYNKDDRRHIDEQWESFIRKNLSYKEADFIFTGTPSKSIIMWMTWWPFSALVTICKDPLRRFIIWMFDNFLVKMFTKIHQQAIGDSSKYKSIPIDETINRY